MINGKSALIGLEKVRLFLLPIRRVLLELKSRTAATAERDRGLDLAGKLSFPAASLLSGPPLDVVRNRKKHNPDFPKEVGLEIHKIDETRDFSTFCHFP